MRSFPKAIWFDLSTASDAGSGFSGLPRCFRNEDSMASRELPAAASLQRGNNDL